jgi:uncharacterized protein (DUF433 family)
MGHEHVFAGAGLTMTLREGCGRSVTKATTPRPQGQTTVDTTTNTTESTRGNIGQGLYSLADLRAYLALSGDAGDATKLEHWLGNVLNPVKRQARLPDHSFSDLVSLFVVRELRRHGVPARTIREGEAYLRDLWRTDRPFVSDLIQTDGRDIFADGARITGQIERATQGGGQQVMLEIAKTFLRDVRYLDGEAQLWSPGPHVVLDPAVQFGDPVVEGTRVPTVAVADVTQARDAATAARRFRLSPEQVRDALAFERRLAAARN